MAEPPAGETPWRTRIEKLEAALAFQKVLAEGYRELLYGRPLPWPETPLPQFIPQAFRTHLDRALAESALGVELVSIECAEAPCIAGLRLPEGSINVDALLGGETWSSHFGKFVARSYNGWVDCGDGRREHVWLLAPAWDGALDPSTMDTEAYWQALRAATDDDASRIKRLQARWDEMRESWACRPR